MKNMDYESYSSLKTRGIKHYLKESGLKTSGRRDELIARVFAASENNVPLAKSTVEVETNVV